MRPKIHTVPLAIFPKSTSRKKDLKTLPTNPSMNSPFLDLSPNTLSTTVTEAELPVHWRRKLNSRSQFPNQEPSRKEKCLTRSSVDTTTEVIYLSGWIIKTLFRNWSGRCQLRVWTITTIFPFSSMEREKNSTHTVPLPFWGLTICWKKEAIRFCQSSLS